MKLRLKMLVDKKKMMQSKDFAASRQSANLRNLLQGFMQFNDDLSKLQVTRVHPMGPFQKLTIIAIY